MRSLQGITMSRLRTVLALAVLSSVTTLPAFAGRVQITGTVRTITQMGTNVGYSAETVAFSLANQPTTLTCTSGYVQFIFSPATVTDAQTRKNMLTILISAQARGTSVEVAYDDSNTYCDQGSPAVYYIEAIA